MPTDLLPDIVLATLLLLLAWGALHAPSRRDAMALFIGFGLVVALIWARLDAPDLALAEAAIGAGLTGTLFLNAARLLPAERQRPIRLLARLPAILFVGFSVALFTLMLLDPSQPVFPVPDSGSRITAENINNSGVDHPVTAVLLNFRAWDTLLELVVLLLALSGLRQLFPSSGQILQPARPWQLLLSWTRILVPLLVVVGGYLLWNGASAPGGAFQAGAMLAAGAVMLRIVGILPPLRWSFWWLRLSVTGGALLFLSVAILTAWTGQGWLVYPIPIAGWLILLIELFATVSIAVTLTLLVVGDREDLRT